MNLFAGRTAKSKYDRRTAIHIAIQESEASTPVSLCNGSPISPEKDRFGVTITCTKCTDKIDCLPDQLVSMSSSRQRPTSLAG